MCHYSQLFSIIPVRKMRTMRNNENNYFKVWWLSLSVSSTCKLLCGGAARLGNSDALFYPESHRYVDIYSLHQAYCLRWQPIQAWKVPGESLRRSWGYAGMYLMSSINSYYPTWNHIQIFIALSLPIRVDQAVIPTPRGRPPSPLLREGGGGFWSIAPQVFSKDDDRALLGLWGWCWGETGHSERGGEGWTLEGGGWAGVWGGEGGIVHDIIYLIVCVILQLHTYVIICWYYDIIFTSLWYHTQDITSDILSYHGTMIS